MKFYISSRFTHKEKVRHIQNRLVSLGHEITCDWTRHEDKRPFEKNKVVAARYAEEDIGGVRDCDVFIALCDDSAGSTGMHTEIGAAISSMIDRKRPRIYVVGKDFDAMFYFHPLIRRRETIDEVFKELKIN
jgi:hypothetical protein